jgi:capsular exopolysaccharide synthesis family protein
LSLDEEAPSLDWRRYVGALLRYKWLIALAGVAGSGAGFGASLLQTPEYQATATVWIEGDAGGSSRSGSRSGGTRGPITAEQLLGSQPQTAWIDLIKSNRVLDLVVRELKLYLTPELASDTDAFRTLDLGTRLAPGDYRLEVNGEGTGFVLSAAAGAVVQRGAVGDSVGSQVGLAWVPPAESMRPRRVIRFSVINPRAATRQLMTGLEASIPRSGNNMKVTLKGEDPAQVQRALNTTVRRFVETAAQLKREKLAEVTRVLGQQLAYANTTLTRAEAELQSFRVHTITLPPDPGGTPIQPGLSNTTDPVYQRFFQMQLEREQLRVDREALERSLTNIPDSGVQVVRIEAVQSVRGATELTNALQQLTNKRAELQTQRARYTDSFPPVQRLMREIETFERQTVPTHLRALLAQLQVRERLLQDQISTTGRDLQSIPPRAIEEARLRRNVQNTETLNNMLQQRYQEARLAELSAQPDVQILDLATRPERPLSQLGLLLLAGGLIGGLALGAGLAVLLEYFDRRVRYPDQVTRGFGLTVLGAIPHVKNHGAGLSGDDAAQVVESLRGLRLNLVHAYGTAGPLLLTVTSPGSGDGKSFIASNLALAFADAGHRTLLIDGDIRRGSLHRVLGVNRKPGLLDFLSGQATREQIIQTTGIPSVEFIGCGTRKTGGPELLASAAMSQLLISLRSEYGVILLDSPPLGAGVDPLVLGSLTGSVLLVFRTGVTDRELAEAKLDQLDRLPIRVVGAVMNDVHPEGVYRYYSYISGYQSRDEDEGAVTALKQLRGVG